MPSRRRQRPLRRPAAALAIATATAIVLLAPAGAAHALRAHASVVAGSATPITTVPHQVALVDVAGASPFDGQYCGGSVLNATHVLTAAHCMVLDGPVPEAKPASSTRVLAGTALLRKPGDPATPGERQVAVSEVHLHPDYSPVTNDSDVAVLTLATPLYDAPPPTDGSAVVAPVALAAAAHTSAAVVALAPVALTGWGYTVAQPSVAPAPDPTGFPQGLQRGTQHLVADATCAASYAGLAGITPRMLCAGGGGTDAGACYGDSGGPLTGADGATPVVEGVVSFGSGCRQPQYPDVYTRVAQPDIAGFVAAVLAPTGDPGVPGDPPAPPPTDPGPLPDPPAPPPTDPGPLPDPPVSGPAPPPDTLAPSQRIIRSRCGVTSCIFNVLVTDALPSAGLKGMIVNQRWVAAPACSRRPAPAFCGPTVRAITARSLGAGRYLVIARRLVKKGSILYLSGVDRADRVAVRAAVVRLASAARIRALRRTTSSAAARR